MDCKINIKNLGKDQISERDINLKFYDNILSIYNIYTEAFYKLMYLENDIIL
jgi:hypothetical protein